MRKISRAFLIVFLLVLIFTACSDKESQSASTTVQSGQPQSPQASGESSAQASGGSAGKTIKPEQLISKNEANTLIGEAVKAGVSDEYQKLGVTTCYYAAENTESKGYLQISVLQKSKKKDDQSSGGSGQSEQPSESQSSSGGGESGEMAPKDLYEGFKKIFSDANTAVAGHIGDDTFISAKSITILSGEYCIVISVGSADPAMAETMLKSAAEMAVNNLNRIQGES